MEAWLLSIDQLARLKIVVEMHTDNGRGRAQESTSCWHERAGCSKRCIAREQRPWFSKLEQGMEAFDVRRFLRSLVDLRSTNLERVEVILPRPRCGCQRSAIVEGGRLNYARTHRSTR